MRCRAVLFRWEPLSELPLLFGGHLAQRNLDDPLQTNCTDHLLNTKRADGLLDAKCLDHSFLPEGPDQSVDVDILSDGSPVGGRPWRGLCHDLDLSPEMRLKGEQPLVVALEQVRSS